MSCFACCCGGKTSALAEPLLAKGGSSEFTRPVGPSKKWQLHAETDDMLWTEYGDIESVVRIPRGETPYQWLSSHAVDLCDDITHLYAIIDHLCTPESCPAMTAGPKFTYLWKDRPVEGSGAEGAAPSGKAAAAARGGGGGVGGGAAGGQLLPLSAPAYIDRVFEFVEEKIDSDALFAAPDENVQRFGRQFKVIFQRLFRVYAHIYHSHFTQFVALEATAHLNTCFKRFVTFTLKFKLLNEIDILPLQQFIAGFIEAVPENPRPSLIQKTNSVQILGSQPRSELNSVQMNVS